MHSNDWNPYFVRRPLPTTKDFESGYWGTVTDPDGIRRNLLEERERRVEDVRDELAHINQLPAGRILDVGCGLGYLLSGVNDEWEKHGIELSRFAAEYASREGRIHVGDLASAAYPDNHFDVVVLYHVIEHMYDPVSEIEEIFRVLRPGGTLIVGTPDFDSACARRFGPRYRMLNDVTHVSLFTRESLDRFLWDHGFCVDRAEFPYFETRHFNREQLERLWDTSQMSPPFYGNIMTLYCHKPVRSGVLNSLAMAGRLAHRVAVEQHLAIDEVATLLDGLGESGGQLWVLSDGATDYAALFESAGYRVASFGEEVTLSRVFGPKDVCLLFGDEMAASTLAASARRAGGTCVALVSRAAEVKAADVVVRIPSNDAQHVELVCSLLVGALTDDVHRDV
jgi:SAM-dependent methyltransferase